MKLSCFFLSSICRVAASIICLICGKADSEFFFAIGIRFLCLGYKLGLTLHHVGTGPS